MPSFHLPDMSCGHCASRVSQALKALDPQCRIDFELRERRIQVQSEQAPQALVEALREAGYPPAPTP
ncbi:heavy-metal-associated domain-containing protein [Inhella proteolytica]|uniref:Heavy-metal-associated domain-containing protein n=1 Tax=Inhella proteolytica TaxID=2795029 RepID=A0A931NGM0_9BURK|nr:heavy-metal-associated domain-containing protein [Inhella proteolytica]MBH9576214.1 heavy-metal-associated domain-containing protein [Inhella proteolytica]